MSSALDCVANDYDNKEDEYDIYDKTSSESNSYFDDIDAEIAELQGYCDLARSIGEETKSKELLNALSVSFEKIKVLVGRRRLLYLQKVEERRSICTSTSVNMATKIRSSVLMEQTPPKTLKHISSLAHAICRNKPNIWKYCY